MTERVLTHRCRQCRGHRPASAFSLRLASGKASRAKVCRSCIIRLGGWLPPDNRPSAGDYRTILRLTKREDALVTEAVNAWVTYRDWHALLRDSRRRALTNDGKPRAYAETTADDVLHDLWGTDPRRWHQLCALVAMVAQERLEAAA